MDIEELEVQGTWDRSRGLICGNGSTGVGLTETPTTSGLKITLAKEKRLRQARGS